MNKLIVADNTPGLNTSAMAFQDYLEEAEICCEHARIAGRQRRYKAACGLFGTASNLYRQAIALDGVAYPAIEERLRDIETEMSIYTELAKSMARPLLSPSRGSVKAIPATKTAPPTGKFVTERKYHAAC